MSGEAWFALLAAALLAPLAWWVAAGAAPRLRLAAVAVALAASGAIYLIIGQPAAIAPPLDPIDALTAKIEERLDQDPTDVDGWRALGRLHVSQGRFDAGADAYAKALALAGDGDAAALVGFAEARLLGDPKRLTGEVAPLLERALELAPDDPRALWYGGHLANERGDRALAERRWRALLALAPPPDLRHAVEAQLGAAPADATPLFELEVSLAPAFAAKLAPGTAVFVFVREGEGRMPLLVKRLTVGQLPATVPLGAGDLLADRAAFDAATTLMAGARVAVNGTASRKPGDVEGLAPVARGAPGRARVVIDAEVR